jgi:mannan endo-1,4-beta-mannosidase
MSTWRKFVALLVTIIVIGGAAGVLWYLDFRHNPAAANAAVSPAKAKSEKENTTPGCLKAAGSFCTGVAVKGIKTKYLADFTRGTGVFPVFVEYYQQFGKPFSAIDAGRIGLLGARPFIQLNPHRINLGDIAAGKYDRYLKAYVLAVKKFGHPVMLSFGHEMNGTWSTWSLPFTKPKTFKAAWIHIFTVFQQEKVKNVTWAWDISHGAKPPEPWYPGNQYVNWVGIDGYMREGQTFAGQFWKSITAVRKFAKKPVFISEAAVAPGKDQVEEINALFAGARERHLKGLVWFDVDKKEPWNIEQSSKAAIAAFRANAELQTAGNSATPSPSPAPSKS